MYYLVLLADKFQMGSCFISVSNFSTLCLPVPMESNTYILSCVLHVRTHMVVMHTKFQSSLINNL